MRLGGSVLGRHRLDSVGGTECPPLDLKRCERRSFNDRNTTVSVGTTYHGGAPCISREDDLRTGSYQSKKPSIEKVKT